MKPQYKFSIVDSASTWRRWTKEYFHSISSWLSQVIFSLCSAQANGGIRFLCFVHDDSIADAFLDRLSRSFPTVRSRSMKLEKGYFNCLAYWSLYDPRLRDRSTDLLSGRSYYVSWRFRSSDDTRAPFVYNCRYYSSLKYRPTANLLTCKLI